MDSKNFMFFILLLLAAGASWYLANTFRSPEVVKTVSDTRTSAFYLKTARILGTDDNGDLLYEIEAAHAEQQAKDRIEFTDVRIRYSPGADVPWIVHADEATLREGSPRIALRGHVRAVSAKSADDLAAVHPIPLGRVVRGGLYDH